jgi:two-component system response regulator YesN
VIQVIEVEVLEAIKSSHRDHVSKALDQLWIGFKSNQVQEKKVKLIVLEILVQLFRTVKEKGANDSQLFDYELGDYEHVMQARTIDELHQFTEKKCLDVLDLLHKQKQLQPNQLIQSMIKIVQEQYHTNISLRSIAQQMFINPVYLGQLFKRDTGHSFNDYLLKVRMEKAKELLLHTDKKVYEIAQEVGYRQLDWFYKRFKAYTGFSAGEYRSSF